MKGILGRKLGMTQVFTAEGDLIPVTVIECEPNVVLQKKNLETDGYEALQLGLEDKKESRATKPELGHVKKANASPKKYVREVKNDEETYEVGQEIKVDIFSAGDMVDVTGISKGKGYTGTIKRYHAHMLVESHGTGPVHRHVGSLATTGRNNGRSERLIRISKLSRSMLKRTICWLRAMYLVRRRVWSWSRQQARRSSMLNQRFCSQRRLNNYEVRCLRFNW